MIVALSLRSGGWCINDDCSSNNMSRDSVNRSTGLAMKSETSIYVFPKRRSNYRRLTWIQNPYISIFNAIISFGLRLFPSCWYTNSLTVFTIGKWGTRTWTHTHSPTRTFVISCVRGGTEPEDNGSGCAAKLCSYKSLWSWTALIIIYTVIVQSQISKIGSIRCKDK